ncbi:hypothetical protein AN958_02858, partial [Leucoagaricus sp. SymC.cos]
PISKSFLKLLDVPFLHVDGTHTSSQYIEEVMGHLPYKNHFVLVSPIHVVHNSATSDIVMTYFKVWDSQRGTYAANLVGYTLQFGHWVFCIMEANANPGASLCQHYWIWGHSSQSCYFKVSQCMLCGDPHYQNSHQAFTGYCKRNLCQSIPKTLEGQPYPHPLCCLNCCQDHAVTLKQCPFWHHQFDKDWLHARY